MPQTLTQTARNYSPEFEKHPVGAPNTAAVNGQFEYADLTATSTVALNGNGDFQTGMTYFRAIIHIKAFVAGTTPSAFAIEAADNVAMSTNLIGVAAQAGSLLLTAPFCLVLAGFAPTGAKRYARVAFIPGAGASGTFDALLSACP